MFKRKIELDMGLWLKSLSIKRKALLVRGARQVGKTTVIEHFLKAHFDEVLKIDFKKEKSAKAIFAGDLDAKTIVSKMKVRYPHYSFDPERMSIFFDEIQECNGARGSLKSLMQDSRFVVACSGSLLGIAGYNEEGSQEVSVGFEYPITMTSMDFEEYLWAVKTEESTIDILRRSLLEKREIDEFYHDYFRRRFLEYLCLGGMPEVVDAYISSSDIALAHQAKKSILSSYKDDFGKHLNPKGEEVIKSSLLLRINRVYEALPSQLANDRHRFVLSHIDSGNTKADYQDAIQWLIDAGIVMKCENVTALALPLSGFVREGYFKLYYQDVGLLLGSLPFEITSALLTGSSDIGIYKGPIYENYIMSALSKNGHGLYYYRKDTGLEIDFLLQTMDEVILGEVKAKNGNAKSAKTLLKDSANGISHCIKFSSSNLGYDGTYLTLPHYMAFLLGEGFRFQ